MLSQLPPLQRRAPGVWVFTLNPPPGFGGHTLTLGATFDGEPIVTPKSVAIATDVWTENYPSRVSGSCSVSTRREDGGGMAGWPWCVALFTWVLRRRRYSLASDTTHPCGSHE